MPTPPPFSTDGMSGEAPFLSLEDLSAAQRSGRLRLGFPQPVEREFRRHTIDAQRPSVLLSCLIGLCCCDLFTVNDLIAAPSDAWLYAVGRFGVITPVGLLAIVIGRRSRRAYEYAICVIPLTMAAVLSWLIINTHGAYRQEYLFGDILVMCASVITRSRQPFACATIGIECVCFGAVLFGSDVVPPGSVLVNALFCATGAVMSLLTAYALEQAGRTAFLMDARNSLLNRQLEVAAMTDPLTGLANRRRLAQVTDELWTPAQAGAALTVSVILLDVDKFKLFNDSYGHAAGDRCLATIAEQVVSVVRTTDSLAVRFGGEELLVMLPRLDLPAAQQIAERIRLAITEAKIPHPSQAAGAIVTASLGVATATTRDCTPMELTAMSDIALYAAKKTGRNRIWPPLEPRTGPARSPDDRLAA